MAATLPRLDQPCGPPTANMTAEMDTGLLRTQMQAGNFRQRRLFNHLPTRAVLTWELRGGELRDFGQWIDAHGFDWFEVQMESPWYQPLPVGQGPHALAWHKVRLISHLTVSNVGPGVYEASADAELAPGSVPTKT